MTCEQVILTTIFNILGLLIGSFGTAGFIGSFMATTATSTFWERLRGRALCLFLAGVGGFMYFTTLFFKVPQ